ncbi:MAG: hypothetical protein NTW22_07420 [Proteobacteria bacterium]|nr:hypothetical protein [Pseudomonadota bacterium]
MKKILLSIMMIASSATYGATLGNLAQAWGQLESAFGTNPFPSAIALNWSATTGYAVTNFEMALLNGSAWQQQAYSLYSAAVQAAQRAHEETTPFIPGTGQTQNIANVLIASSNIIFGGSMTPLQYWQQAQKYWAAALKQQ